jgi:hypothetical protein
MHKESGQYAIECAGLNAEFKSIARYQDQEFRIYDKQGELLHLDDENQGDRPEIDRGQLRQMLLGSLPEGLIQWGPRSDHSGTAGRPNLWADLQEWRSRTV